MGLTVYAQPCSILSAPKTCINEPLSFQVSTTGSVSSYQWDFNGEGTSTGSAPVFIFSTPGTKTITVKVFFAGAGSCTATKQVTVNHLPQISFKVDTASSYFCLGKNNICILDQSQRSLSGAPLKQRVVVWGDGSYDISSSPESDRTDCHHYAKTGTYDITVEITDTNGCKVSQHRTAKVYKNLAANLTYYVVRNCDSTTVCLNNTSQYDTLLPTKAWWYLGNGIVDSVNFNQACRVFHTSSASFKPVLVIRNPYCVDSISASIAVNVGVPLVSLTKDKSKSCISDSKVTFMASKVNGGIYSFDLFDSNMNLRKTFYNGTDTALIMSLPGLGKWYVKMNMIVGNCLRTVLDTVYVVGAKSLFTLRNSLQCSPRDTVFGCAFPTMFGTTPSQLTYLWHFGDMDALPCTTTVSQNQGVNCNFSTLADAGHKYQRDTCFTVRLWVNDTLNKCVTDYSMSVSIGPPSFKRLSYTTPGFCYIPGEKNDLTYAFSFNADTVKPECGIKDILITTDSARYWQGFVPLASIQPLYVYDSVANPDGWVTLGVILVQGNKSYYTSCNSVTTASDRECRDTIWYHKAFRLLPQPVAEYVLDEDRGCAPLTVTGTVLVPWQKFISKAYWDWGDGTIDTIPIAPNALIPPNTHTYTKNGRYRPVLILENENGCTQQYLNKVDLGYFKAFLSDTIQCLQANFKDSVEYFNLLTYNWNNPARAAAGKERIWWYFGDGDSAMGHNPSHTYKSTGTYKVTMITTDSASCRDTMVINVHVAGPAAGIRAPLTTSVCNEIITFYDSSMKGGNQLKDSIVSWWWDFGDNKNPSILKDATHAYTSFGDFEITHIITNARGCSDTARITIHTIGPRPRFSFIGDSIGCAPFAVKLKNNSDTSTISDYIWSFGDSVNTSLSTNSDSSVGFIYKNAGVYYLKLTGAKNVYSSTTGNTYYCTAFYPDTPTHPVKKVIVWPTPPVDFDMPDTVCRDVPFQLSDQSDTIYTSYVWYFENGDSLVSATGQASLNFPDTGLYNILYAPRFTPLPPRMGCYDSISRSVYVAGISADFEVDEKLSEDPIFWFSNKSKKADTYSWDFGHPKAGAGNYSIEINPGHNYDPDTGYFMVCLKAANRFGCEDTVCKEVHVTFYPYVIYYNVFSPGNEDGKNDEFDIDIKGEAEYHLKIFNRWGELVFESNEDGKTGDGKNWNGQVHNTGESCPAGVYFYVFNYSLLKRPAKTVTGTCTLIR